MTVYCAQCNTANRDGSLFCNRCGQRLAEPARRPCPNCGAHNLPNAGVCQSCGSPLPPPEAVESGPPDVAALEQEEEEPLETEVPSLADLAPGVDSVLHGAEGDQPGAGTGTTPFVAPLADADELLQRLEAGLGPGPATPGMDGTARSLPPDGIPAATAAPRPLSPGETFAAVVATRDAWSPPLPPKGQSVSERVARFVPRVLYLFLFVAVLVPFLVPGDWSGSTIPLTPSTAAFFQTIAALRPGSPVLVAFDYDPSNQGEMDPQARAVLAHLMQRGVRIAAVSLLPAGAAQAQLAFAGTATAQGYRYGDDYINLGYLAGDEAALATLGQNITAALPQDFAERQPTSGRTVLQGVRGVRDFALVVVLGAEERSVLAWLTQVQARFGVSMVAGVSAASAVQMQPYLASGQLAGLLTGLPGAAEYELLMNHPGPAVRMLDAQSLAHVVIVVFVLLGNVGTLLWGLRRKAAVPNPVG